MRKIYIGLIISLLLVSGVYAAWRFSITSELNADVKSLEGVISLVIPFDNISIDTSVGADTGNSTAKFNLNKATNLTVNIEEIYQDNSAGQCLNGQGDCVVEYFICLKGHSPPRECEDIWNGKVQEIPYSTVDKFLTVQMNCTTYSCPQTRRISVTLSEEVL